MRPSTGPCNPRPAGALPHLGPLPGAPKPTPAWGLRTRHGRTVAPLPRSPHVQASLSHTTRGATSLGAGLLPAGLERIYEAANQPSSLSLAVAAGPEGDLWSTGSPLPGAQASLTVPLLQPGPGQACLCRMSGDGWRPYIFSGSWAHFQAGWVCHPPQKVLEREASVPIFLRGRKTHQLLCSVCVGTRPWGCGLYAAGDDLCVWAYSRRSPNCSWLPHPFSLWLEAWEV